MFLIKGFSRNIPNYFSIKKYSDDFYKLTYHKELVKNGGFEDLENIEKIKCEQENDIKLRNNICRARNMIFEYAMCNEFEYFCTMTLDKNKYDRYNLDKFIKDLGQFMRDKRKKYKTDIQYLLIPEKHKDGAWHLHGLLKNIPLGYLVKNENGYLDWEDYKNKFGWISLDKVKNKVACSKYITKYITKNIDKNVNDKNKKLYYVSRGLKKAKKIEEGSLPSSILKNVSMTYENDYVKVKEMSLEEYQEFINIIT